MPKLHTFYKAFMSGLLKFKLLVYLLDGRKDADAFLKLKAEVMILLVGMQGQFCKQ